jgi:hypothetical protein
MTDNLPLFEHARARSSDPQTSHDAAASIVTKPSQRDVIATLKAIGPSTQKDLEEHPQLKEDYSPSRIRTAVRELADSGLVVDTGEKKTLKSGRRAIIWKAS